MVEEVEQDLNGTVYLSKGNYEYQVGKGGTNGTSNYASNGGTSYFKDSSETKIELEGGKKGTTKTLSDLILGRTPDLGGKVKTNKYNSNYGYPGKTTVVEAFDGNKSAFDGAKSVFSEIDDIYKNRGAGGDSADVDPITGHGRDDTKGTGGFIRITYKGP